MATSNPAQSSSSSFSLASMIGIDFSVCFHGTKVLADMIELRRREEDSPREIVGYASGEHAARSVFAVRSAGDTSKAAMKDVYLLRKLRWQLRVRGPSRTILVLKHIPMNQVLVRQR